MSDFIERHARIGYLGPWDDADVMSEEVEE
jgi:hypothetical protein